MTGEPWDYEDWGRDQPQYEQTPRYPRQADFFDMTMQWWVNRENVEMLQFLVEWDDPGE